MLRFKPGPTTPTLVFAAVTIFLLGGWTEAQDAPPKACTDCHAKATHPGEERPPAVLLAGSVHGDLDCTSCHAGIAEEDFDATVPNPHGEAVEPVACGDCHEDEADVYLKHGRIQVGTDPDAPRCRNCHGSHDILPSTNPGSRVHRLNIAGTCEKCHVDADLIKNHEILRDEPIQLYEGSVHGQGPENGTPETATCRDCHASGKGDAPPTAHRILGANDPESSIFHFNIPETCGRCHAEIAEDYWEGIHGTLVRRGETDAPVCTRCHGEHGILPVSDLRSPVSAARLAVATCAPCHESELLNQYYGVPPGKVRSYVDTYHGLKRKSGDVHVANCASCHGDHRILPQADPRSSIHPNNVQETCGQCHPNISNVLAGSPIHAPGNGAIAGWPHFISVLYMWVIGIAIALMLLHNLGHWGYHVRLRIRDRAVIRLTTSEVAQHWVLMTSFIVLAVTGFSLRFSEAWWVVWLFGWGGGEGFVIRGVVHRVAAAVFGVWMVWHMAYLFGLRGRQWMRDVLPSKRDTRDIKQNALLFLGKSDTPPRFARFSYMEKFEYWGMIWGAIIMAATGILLCFDNYFIETWGLGKVVLDCAVVVHYYEAWLATLAILIWHIYATIFSPSVFPMNPAWWAGKMPREMYVHEHPEDPGVSGMVRPKDR